MPSPFTNLVIGGAASLNIAVVGVLQELQPYLHKINRLLGVSSGSIIATLIAIGCTPEEIRDYFDSVDLSKFKINYYDPTIYYSLIMKRGIHDSNKFRKLIEKILLDKTGIKDITFKQIYEIYGKTLVIPVTCVNKRQQFFYNHVSNPEMVVSHVIQMSCCLPIIFTPVVFKSDVFLDGGLVDNFPLYYFNEDILPNSKIDVVKPPGVIPNKKTLGILVIDPYTSKDPDVDPYLGDDKDKISTFFGYMLGILNTLLTTNSNIRMGPGHWDSVISVTLNSVNMTNMTISDETKEDLILKGQLSATEFLKLRKKVEI